MKQCEFCRMDLPEGASFCGHCGRISPQTADQGTFIGDLPMSHLIPPSDENTPTIPLERDRANSPALAPQQPIRLEAVEREDDEEEKRRRAALLGLGVPLLAGQPLANHIPTMQGTPQLEHIPTLQGSPTVQGGMAPSTPAQPPATTLPKQYGPHPHPPHHPTNPPGGSTGGLPGCLTVSMIVVATIVIILASIIGLGLTVWSPNLTLSGSSTVSPGGTLTLQGNHFFPNSSVTLTLDSGIPFLFVQHTPATPLVYAHTSYPAYTLNALQIQSTLLSPNSTNTITVGGNGSFTITLTVNPSLALGTHVVHATETFSHRSASLSFSVGTAVTTATATVTQTQTPTPTPTLTPTPTATPAPPTLSCAVPSLLNLGPVSELSSQIATGQVNLCTGGTGTLTWNASWDQNQAPWLQLPTTSGTIQAPNQTTVTVNAVVANLSAGTYTATLTFTGQESNTTQTVTITLTVKASCVQATPPRMIFTGVQGTSDPTSSQPISLTNCGLTSNWSAKITNNSSWLSLNATKGVLKGGTTTNIAVTASVVKTGLKVGSYRDVITLTIGSQTASVTVLLTVTPRLQLSTNSLSFDLSCAAATQSISITNGGAGTLTWTVGTPSDTWLTVRTAAGNAPGTLTLQASPGNQTLGTHTATVTVTGSDGATQTVTVTMNVSACIQ